MRIAIFTNNYLPNPYGVSSSIESFRTQLEKMGHTVYIFAPGFKGYEDKNPNVFRYPSIGIIFRGIHYPIVIPFSYKIGRILKDLKIDIVHSQHPNLLGWEARRWARKKKVPLVFTWHTLYDQYAHFVPVIPKKISAWWAIFNAVNYANKASGLIVPTHFVKKIIKNWGVDVSNANVIPSGVEESKFENANAGLVKEKFKIQEDDFVILLVCRLTAEKNVGFIFDSLIPVLKKNKKMKFLVVGGGNLLDEYEEMVRINGIKKQVFFTGAVLPDEVKDYYAAADIFVYASKSETQGMILTEAMYMGLPIVAVKAPGAQDLVGNFVTGILTKEDHEEFSSAVSKLFQDEEIRKQYSQNAKKVALENYTAKISTEKLLMVYENSIKNS